MGGNSITQAWCENIRTVFDDYGSFVKKGGLPQMGRGLTDMVLVLSVWNDFYSNMLWLDSNYPEDSTKLGADRGSCPTTSGEADDLIKNAANSNVAFCKFTCQPLEPPQIC